MQVNPNLEPMPTPEKDASAPPRLVMKTPPSSVKKPR
jgi:hypothetical protein